MFANYKYQLTCYDGIISVNSNTIKSLKLSKTILNTIIYQCCHTL